MFRRKSASPCGTVTYLLTDVENSTREWRNDANGMDGRLRHLEAEIGSGPRRVYPRESPKTPARAG